MSLGIFIVQMVGRSPSNTISRAASIDDNEMAGAVMSPTARTLGGGGSVVI